MALPFHPQILLGWPHKFKAAFVDKKRLRKGRADILCNHATFSTREEFGKVVHPNAKFLTILRDPITRFESQFFFERFDRIFKLENASNPILEFHKDFVSLTSRGYGWRVANKLLLLRNGMLFDLTGINFLRTIYNKTDFNHHIKTINHIFDLVMITEYFDESLVLLMKLLGWGMLDIVYMKKVVRNSTHSVLLTKETKTMISEQNKGDIELYQYFKDSFWKQVENYGKEFERDVEVFRKLNKEINTQCHQQKDTISANRLRRKLSDFGLDRNEWEMIGEIDDIDPCFCSKLHRDENEYLDYFWAKFPPYHYLPSVDKGKWLNC